MKSINNMRFLIKKLRSNGCDTILRANIPTINKITVFLMTFAILTIPSVSYAFNPPIGIPDPSWGSMHPIDTNTPAQPGGWPAAEVPGYYYIDNTHIDATDAGNTYGYPDSPRVTIPEITYSAGSYVEVHGGPYSGSISVKFNGTNTNPCWFRGTSVSKPIITGGLRIYNSTFAIIENLDFNGGNSTCLSIADNDIHHISIRNSNFRNRNYTSHASALNILPNTGGNIHDIIIYNCNFEELGDWQTTVDEDFHGINPNLWNRNSATELYNIWMLNNTFYHISGNGIQVNAGNWSNSHEYLHHIYIGFNTTHACRQSGIWSKQASDIIISQNTCYDHRKHGYQPGDGIGYQYGPNYIWIIFNEIYDCNNGIRQSDTSWTYIGNKAFIIGNLIYNIHPESGIAYNPNDGYRPGIGINMWQGVMTRQIIDNTIYDVHGGINCHQAGGATLISGNVISDIHYQDYHVSAFNAYNDVDVDHCIVYDPDHNARFRWWGSVYANLTSFKSAKNECLNCIESDPLFNDAGSNDLTLRQNSPAKNVGVEASAYDIFFGRYGIDIKKGFDGISRPRGQEWDLGAYEAYIAGPTNLRIKEIIK